MHITQKEQKHVVSKWFISFHCKENLTVFKNKSVKYNFKCISRKNMKYISIYYYTIDVNTNSTRQILYIVCLLWISGIALNINCVQTFSFFNILFSFTKSTFSMMILPCFYVGFFAISSAYGEFWNIYFHGVKCFRVSTPLMFIRFNPCNCSFNLKINM